MNADPEPGDGCASHPDVPLTVRCVACNDALCAACWQSVVDGKPTCQGCVPLLTRPVPTIVPLVGAALALLVLVRIGWIMGPASGALWLSYAVAAVLVLVSAWRLTASANERRRRRTVKPRPRNASTVVVATGHPYRGAFRGAARRLAPPVSGVMAAFVVAVALVLAAAAVPALLQLPRWLELELVLAVWWLVWTVALTVLLYRGWRVAKDPS